MSLGGKTAQGAAANDLLLARRLEQPLDRGLELPPLLERTGGEPIEGLAAHREAQPPRVLRSELS